jgi:hypothetical protein
MNRFDIINKLIEENGFKSYLEIGTQQSVSGHQINIEHKTGVDPAPMERVDGDYDDFHQVKSDEFFANNKKKFDIIFIDGDHSYEQSRADFSKAIYSLNKGGMIVMHDCLPHNEEYAGPLWCGEVFKTLADIHFSGMDYKVYDHDHGCAVIPKQRLKNFHLHHDYTFQQFINEREKFNICLM